MTDWVRRHLACPHDHQPLETSGRFLVCPDAHAYPIVDDVPIMLLADRESTHGYIERTLKQAGEPRALPTAPGRPQQEQGPTGEVDDFVQGEIVHSCGNLYEPVLNRLTRYPIPDIRLPSGHGARLLDVGCNWGRWSISAAQKGYRPVGVDPSLDAVLAARRVCRQLKVEAEFLVGDARFLPFATDAFDVGFSFSVFQHFSKDNARASLDELARVVTPGGTIQVQMPNKYGVRSTWQRARRGLTEGAGFEVRYWTPTELLEAFGVRFGTADVSVHAYFGLGVESADLDLLPLRHRAVVHASDLLRAASRYLPFMARVADSVYVTSVNEK